MNEKYKQFNMCISLLFVKYNFYKLIFNKLMISFILLYLKKLNI